ncbi:hypothetical protein QOZ80_2BG0175950 [Eleusine coracana subsp. coracana]|nr:hypothetical protein QOZ80_2BG0175950 [Eleusine coracana subsp. coracana]
MPGGEYVDHSQESPEVAAVIARKTFSEKCSDLSNESEKIYNWSFGSAQYAGGSSSSKMAMYRPRRFHVPSRYVSSPYVHERAKVSVSAKEREIYRVLLDVSNNAYNKKYIIDYKNVRVKFGSLGSSLRPGGKVETYVVNALCKKIFDKLRAKRSLKHFFFTPISRGERDFLKLLVPSRVPMLLLYCIIQSCCSSLFSLKITDSAFHQHVKAAFLPNFMKLWMLSGKVDCSSSDKFEFVDVPQCSNNEDDGILIMKFLEEWEPTVDLKSKFEASDVPNLRIKYANEMIFNHSNVANDGLSILKSFDNEVYSKYFQGEA